MRGMETFSSNYPHCAVQGHTQMCKLSECVNECGIKCAMSFHIKKENPGIFQPGPYL